MSDPLRDAVQAMTGADDASDVALGTAAASDDIQFPTFDHDALAELATFGRRRPIASGELLFGPGDDPSDLSYSSSLKARSSSSGSTRGGRRSSPPSRPASSSAGSGS